MSEELAPGQNFDQKNLMIRVASSCVLAPVVLFAIYCGGWFFALLAMAAMFLGLAEGLPLISPSMPTILKRTAFGALGAVLGVGFLDIGWGLGVCLASSLVLYILTYWREKKSAIGMGLGFLYIASAGLGLLYLNIDMGVLFYLMAVVWGTDTGAFVAGRLIGGPKLCPKISPKKTWAGLIGGMVLASTFGYWGAAFFGFDDPQEAGLLAATLAIVSQVGDFLESFVKRRAGVKDSGSLIPGHGGVLDRIDGLLSAAIFFALYLAL